MLQKREDLLSNLTCAEPPEDLTTSSTSEASITTASLETVPDLYTSQEVSGNGQSVSTEREDVILPEIVQHTPIPIPNEIKSQNILTRIPMNINLNIIHDNNLESNDIPKIAHQDENELSEEEANRLEDERHMQHKMLHNEYARLGNIGNFENIFSQPADHFVPPLVMAKARLSDDMTVLSLEEKQAQQLSEQRKSEYRNYHTLNLKPESYTRETTTDKTTITDKPLIITTSASKIKDTKKYISTKKYNEKYGDPKNKNIKAIEKSIKLVEKSTTHAPTTFKTIELNKSITTRQNKSTEEEEDASIIDLSVIIKDHNNNQSVATTQNSPTSVDTTHSSTEDNTKKVTITATEGSVTTVSEQGMTHEVIKITILDEDSTRAIPTVFEITTKVPIPETSGQINNVVGTTIKTNDISAGTPTNSGTNTDFVTSKETLRSTKSGPDSTTANQEHMSTSAQTFVETLSSKPTFTTSNTHSSPVQGLEETTITISNSTVNNTTSSNATTTNVHSVSLTTQNPAENTEIITNTTEVTEDIDDKLEEIHDGYDTSTLIGETTDDMDSPLLSAANEPLHRPNRSRRPQQPPNRKFNPFRILG